MLGELLDLMYDVIFRPHRAMQEIAARHAVGQALLVFLLSVLIPIWAVYLGLKAAGLPSTVNMLAFIQVLGSLVMWIIGAAVFHLIAEFFGGRGTARGLLAAMGFAHLPRIFIVPFWVLAAILPGTIKTVLMAVSGLIVMFWTLSLYVIAIKEAQCVSSVKAVLILLTPGLVAVALVIVAFSFISAIITRLPLFM